MHHERHFVALSGPGATLVNRSAGPKQDEDRDESCHGGYNPFTLACAAFFGRKRQRGVSAMSWTDALKGSLGDILGQTEAAALPGIMNQVLRGEGLQSMLAKLQEQGLGEHVRSWLDQNRQNIPLTGDQLQSALGNEQVQQLAAAAGIPVDRLLAVVAQYLPHAASTAAAEGEVPGDAAGR
jgi:uncharacterized protein YidB (DUF937 family)